MTTRGDRLRAYLLMKTGGRTGWQAELVAASGVKRQTITKYTRPDFDRYPDLKTLAQLAEGLKVPTFEVVAAMDGDAPPSLTDPQFRVLVRALVRSELDAELDDRQVPRRPPLGRAGEAG